MYFQEHWQLVGMVLIFGPMLVLWLIIKGDDDDWSE
jgi:hypothetical protein